MQQSHDKKIKGGVLLGSGYGDDGLDRRTRGGDEKLRWFENILTFFLFTVEENS